MFACAVGSLGYFVMYCACNEVGCFVCFSYKTSTCGSWRYGGGACLAGGCQGSPCSSGSGNCTASCSWTTNCRVLGVCTAKGNYPEMWWRTWPGWSQNSGLGSRPCSACRTGMPLLPHICGWGTRNTGMETQMWKLEDMSMCIYLVEKTAQTMTSLLASPKSPLVTAMSLI